jgi:hypothetical protein
VSMSGVPDNITHICHAAQNASEGLQVVFLYAQVPGIIRMTVWHTIASLRKRV